MPKSGLPPINVPPLFHRDRVLKRPILALVTVLAIAYIGLTLAGSWSRPQEQTRLDLLQTDLVLLATEWQPAPEEAALKAFLLGDDPQKPYDEALENYQTAQAGNRRVLADLDRQASIPMAPDRARGVLAERTARQDTLRNMEVNAGLILARRGQLDRAIALWEDAANPIAPATPATQVARVLRGLWNDPAVLLPDAEDRLRHGLDGWFRDEALERLYSLQQRTEMLGQLAAHRQLEAALAIQRLAAIGAIPVLGAAAGALLWIVLGVQRLFFPASSPLRLRPPAGTETPAAPDSMAVSADRGDRKPVLWEVPWSGETTWEVIVLWFAAFLAISQVLLPLAFGALGIVPDRSWSYRAKAWLVLVPYVLSMAPVVVILWRKLKPFFPLPAGWFAVRFWPPGWIAWGIGGYLAAAPVVRLVSLFSQQLLQGQGGGNPLLPILVESQDGMAKAILWATVAIAAPLLEELLFRGFLLPSLTRFLPFWASLLLSSACFAIAHLNLADLLPLLALGVILGFVYARSRNLLAPMLLHCLWNTGSFLSLLALGAR